MWYRNTVFWETYEDAQRTFNASFPGGQETLFFNAAELEVTGIELEGSWAVTDSLLLRGNAMYQDAEFNEFSADLDFDGIDDVDLSGKPPTRAPEYMATIDGTYTFDLNDSGTIDINLRMAYEDESIAAMRQANLANLEGKALNAEVPWDELKNRIADQVEKNLTHVQDLSARLGLKPNSAKPRASQSIPVVG